MMPTPKHFFRVLLACLFLMAALASAKSINGIEIDEKATAQAPWKEGKEVPNTRTDNADLGFLGRHDVYRIFLGITPKGYYLVQDFYVELNRKYTNPYLVRSINDVEEGGYFANDITIEGEYITWYLNGEKAFDVKFINGKKEGVRRIWYNNGQLLGEAYYVNNKRDGLDISWSYKGVMTKKFHLKEEMLDGLCTRWHENGQKSEEATWIKGKSVGLESWWHENGQLQAQGYRDANGLLDGEWKRWDSDGILLRRTWYKEDKIIKREEFSKKK